MAGAYHILDHDGGADETALRELGLSHDQMLDLFRLMVLARRADVEAMALQRQGELAVYPPLLGQEAAQVGSASALRSEDYIFPSYRELGAALVRGVDLADYLHYLRGTWHGGLYDPIATRFAMVSIPVASQILHAVGYALGAKLDGASVATLAYFGDGATSQGDFSEGCNFAAVFKAPVVFFCQNNHWAISVPFARQTSVPIWKKADAYGFPGVFVDGNDVLAIYQVTREATERARLEGLPTLIEALTYRLGPHSTADDASRYQPAAEIESWRRLDPIERYRKFLLRKGLLTAEYETRYQEEADKLAAHIRAEIVGAPPPPIEDLLRWVFAEPTQHLLEQKRAMIEEAERLPD